MKRILCIILTVAMLFSLSACSCSKKPADGNKEPLTPAGTYEPGVSGFYDIQSDLFDYFYPLIGFGFISHTNEEGKWNNPEIVKFAMIRLSYEGEDIYNEGVSKRQIERATRRYFGQEAENLDTLPFLKYDQTDKTYTVTGLGAEIGKYMVLYKLVVGEDGVCTALFDRLDIPDQLPDYRTEEEMKLDLLNRWYEEIDSVPERVSVTFREHQNETYGYYLELISLRSVPTEE